MARVTSTVLRGAVLLASAWVLIATSRAPLRTHVYSAEGTCGPAEQVFIDTTVVRQVYVDGGTVPFGGLIGDQLEWQQPEGKWKVIGHLSDGGGWAGGECSGPVRGDVVELSCHNRDYSQKCTTVLTPLR
jgi:hypothetical protein